MTTLDDIAARDPYLGSFATLDDRLAFERQSGRMEAERDAAKVTALIVAAAGGSVFVPDQLAVGEDIFMYADPIAGGTRYWTSAALTEGSDRT